MDHPVKARHWRSRAREVRHEHTREVRSESLSAEVQAVLLEMAQQIATLNLEVAELKMRLAPIEEANRMLAAEAARRVAA